MGGLYDKGILGSSDNIMALSYIQKGDTMAINKDNSDTYKQSVVEFQERVKNIRVGYVPGLIRHYYHGSKDNRQYGERWKILVKYAYCPLKHITYDENGIIIPTSEFPPGLFSEIMNYFSQRNEDDIYKDKNIQEMIKQLSSGDIIIEEEDDDPADMAQQMGKMLANLMISHRE